MTSSPNNQNRKLRIGFIAALVLALLVIAFLVLTSPKAPKPIVVVTPIVEAVSKAPTIPEDSLKREREREIEREKEGYAKEQARFAKVLKEASDKELFVVLNYAIAQRYVPNRVIDPFHDMFVMVGCWQRSLMVYDNLSDRKDLLKKIYPDLKVLDEYVNWRRQSGVPYPDTIVSKAILKNAKENSRKMDYKLEKEFFGTPLMRY